MTRVGWICGVAIALGVLGHASEARATCTFHCEFVPIYDDCSAPGEVEDGIYEWERLDELRFSAACTETCCVPGDCSDPSVVEPPLSWIAVRSADGGEPLDIELSTETLCDVSVVRGPIDLESGQRYTVTLEERGYRITLETVSPASETGGCSVGGSGRAFGLSALLLLALGLGLVAGRQRWETAP